MKLLSFLAHSCAFQASFDVSKRSDDVQAEKREQRLWKKFKEQQDRNFTDLSTEREHFRVFRRRLQLVDQHEKLFKAKKVSFQLKLNKFADQRPKDGSTKEFPKHNSPLPESVDWRTYGAVSPVKNQRGCGSCYAFAAVGALEGQNAIKYGKRVELSVQNLVDCSFDYGNGGCFGGDITAAFEFVQDYGLVGEKAYPYQAQSNLFCYWSGKRSEIEIEGFQKLPVDEEALKRAVATVGPIAVALYVNIETFDLYKGGVYHDPRNSGIFGHGMLLVGYGTDPLHGDYWILKNSYGSDWGEGGYMRLARNRSGISAIFEASFPLVSLHSNNQDS